MRGRERSRSIPRLVSAGRVDSSTLPSPPNHLHQFMHWLSRPRGRYSCCCKYDGTLVLEGMSEVWHTVITTGDFILAADSAGDAGEEPQVDSDRVWDFALEPAPGGWLLPVALGQGPRQR